MHRDVELEFQNLLLPCPEGTAMVYFCAVDPVARLALVPFPVDNRKKVIIWHNYRHLIVRHQYLISHDFTHEFTKLCLQSK